MPPALHRSRPLRTARLRAAGAALLLALAAQAAAAGLTIVSPAPEQVVHDNAGDVNVAIALEDGARLPPGYRIRLLLDGEPAAPDHRGLGLRLTGVNRGTHSLQALIVDEDGRVLASSAPVTFTVWQASRLNPRGPK